jgi:Tol biopolymer transport system component
MVLRGGSTSLSSRGAPADALYNRGVQAMPLAPGTRLGPYELTAPIGAGGMGEVYRARDTRLGRDVAVKVLPDPLAGSAQALARFEREARVVAALSHPNILAIHDVGREGPTAFAVMELVDGTTLREELRGGPLSPRAAADYAAQVAQGLAAAHEKGVVHRDLKPENLMVTREGRVKILDFGLASERLPSAGTGGDTQSPTLARETDPGTVLGTVGYMSPEQVRGEVVDHRSDIFSLGCVLHEMLSGRRPFARATAAETMTAILREDATPLSESGRTVPPALERIVSHCLEKKPEQRFQSARDLAFDLETRPSSSGGAASATAEARRPTSWRRVIGGLTALLLLGAGYAAGRRAAPPAARAPATARFMQITDLPGTESTPSLSPDGKTVAFVARFSGDADVFVQRVGGHNPINLTPDCDRDDTGPAFAPDGERIAFHSECEGGGLFLMGATGESRRKVADTGYDPSWSPDGRSLAVASEPMRNPLARRTQSVVSVIDLATGASRRLSEQDGLQPGWSPDGRRIAFWGLRGGMGGGGTRDIWTVAATGGEPVEVTNDTHVDWNPVWSPDGRLLYFASGRSGALNLWRVPIDPATGVTMGAAEPVTLPSGKAGSLTIARSSGQLAFESREERSPMYRVAFDPERGRLTGTPELILGGSRVIESLGLSPDGRWVAFTSSGLEENLFVVRVDGTGYRQITDDLHRNRGPNWSTDGRLIGFYSNRSGRYKTWTLRPDGSNLELLAESDRGSMWYPEWAPNGRLIAVAGQPMTRLVDPSKPLHERVVLELPRLPEGSTFHALGWSADSGTICGMGLRPDGNSGGVWLYRVGTRTYERVTNSGRIPQLLADGRGLVYYEEGGKLLYLDMKSGRSSDLVTMGWSGFTNNRHFRVSRDNRTIVFLRSENEADIWLMSPE